jgi:hypothetical protein
VYQRTAQQELIAEAPTTGLEARGRTQEALSGSERINEGQGGQKEMSQSTVTTFSSCTSFHFILYTVALCLTSTVLLLSKESYCHQCVIHVVSTIMYIHFTDFKLISSCSFLVLGKNIISAVHNLLTSLLEK